MKGQRGSHGKVSAGAAGRGVGGGMKGGEAASPAAVEKEAERTHTSFSGLVLGTLRECESMDSAPFGKVLSPFGSPFREPVIVANLVPLPP